MQISPISYAYNTRFDGTGRTKLKNGSTILAEITHNKKGKITDLSVKVLRDRQELGTFVHEWTKGTYYDAFLQSSWAKRIYEQLNITDEQDKTAVDDAIFEAQLDEIENTAKADADCSDTDDTPIDPHL